MAIEKGEHENEVPKNQIETLTNLVIDLQKQLKAVKSEQAQTQSGIDPEQLVKLFAEYNAQSKKATEKDYSQGIAEEDIPQEDYDENGVTFCAPFTGYVITDDRRKGYRVILPYNKESIFFKYQGTRKFAQGKHNELMSFSTYTSHSKKEQEWLRKHTFFLTMFYESSTDAMTFDVSKAQKIARVMTMLSKMELNQIIARCKEYEVAINHQDISVMRTTLALKMAERELESERTTVQRRLMDLEKEKALLLSKE